MTQNTVSEQKQSKKRRRKQAADSGPPEDSIALRVVVCLMAIFCIVTSCTFIVTSVWLMLLYVWAAIAGSYLSYTYRQQKNVFIGTFTIVGIAAVIYAFGKEMVDNMYSGAGFDLRDATVHLVAGTFAMHTFELRTRKEINQSALVGLTLMCLISPVAKNLFYGICVVVYICLGGVMLYYWCHSRTNQSWLEKPIASAPIITSMAVDPARRRRMATGSAALVISLLPLLSAVLFIFIPRGDFLVDRFRAWSQQKMQQLLQRQADEVAKNSPTYPRDDYAPHSTKNSSNSSSSLSPLNRGSQGRSAGAAQNGHNGQNAITAALKQSFAQKTLDQRVESENAERSFGLRTPHDENGSQVVYRVWSDRSLFLRRFCYDTFDGQDWFSHDPKHREQVAADKGTFDLSKFNALKAPPQVPFVSVTQRYEVESDMGRFIAVGWIPQKLSINSSTLSTDEGGTLQAKLKLKAGTRYSATSEVPIYDLKRMREDVPIDLDAARKIRDKMDNYLQLPESHDIRVTAVARQAAGFDGSNWFTKAERIAQYLRSSYTYSTEPKSSDPTNALGNFVLFDKQGDCRDFASAFVIMCRCVGIPARCIGGYAPGDFNLFLGCREVRLSHAHAWGEVYLPPYGWVPFDATPGGIMPAPEREHSYDIFSKLTGPSNTARPLDFAAMLKMIERLLVAIFATVVAAVLGWNLYKRWQTWRYNEKHMHPASKLYHRMLADLRKLQVVKRPSDTPHDVRQQVVAACQSLEAAGKPCADLPDTVNQFLEVYSQCYFGDKQNKLPELEKLRERIHTLMR